MRDIKGKKILIQGAGRGNLGFIKNAKKNGVITIVTGLGGDYPCMELADKNIYADISNPEAVLNIAKEEKVDGVVICCSDTGLKAVGRCNDILSLSGISEQSAILSSNKLYMKERLVAANVRTAKFCKISSKEDLQKAKIEIGFPLIIKAVDLQGSRGIYIVKEDDDLYMAFDNVMKATKQDFCIIEEYIIGNEFGAQAFVYNGEILFILPHGDETIQCGTQVPIGHYMPYDISKSLYEDICLQTEKAIKSIGFNNCAINLDFIERNGSAYIIELTGRVGANCLPELTSNYLGINYYDMILRTALGESPISIFEQRKSPCATLARMVFSEKNGIVAEIETPQELDVEINMFIKPGSEVRTFTNSNDAIGEVIVKAESLSSCKQIMERILNKIRIKYV